MTLAIVDAGATFSSPFCRTTSCPKTTHPAPLWPQVDCAANGSLKRTMI